MASETTLSFRYLQSGEAPDGTGIVSTRLQAGYWQFSNVANSALSTRLQAGYWQFSNAPNSALPARLEVGYIQFAHVADDVADVSGSWRETYDQDYALYIPKQELFTQVVYRCTLTRNGVDWVIPIQSIQLRVSWQDETSALQSCSVTIPAYQTLTGLESWLSSSLSFKVEMVARYADDSTESFAMAEVDYESVQINQGAFNRTMTIRGLRTVEPDTSMVFTPDKVQTYNSNLVDNATIRCKPQFGLLVGMVVPYDGYNWQVREIVYNIGINSSDMDISLER